MGSEASTLTRLPYEWFRRMRATCPVWFDETSRMWNVFRYDDVSFVLTNPAVFSAEVYPGSPVPGLPSIHGTDDPRHRKLRSLVSLAFTPRMIADLVPRIEQVTDELLDAVIPQGEMDVIHDLAYPLPLILISELLGVPLEDQASFREWSNAMISNNTPEEALSSPEQHRWATQSFYTYFLQQVEEHRRQPREDLISRLLEAEIDGEHLTEQELISICILLTVAGNETTANLIGNAMMAFQEYSEVMDELRADPSLMPSTIEEILRIYPSVVASERFTTQEVTLAGVRIPAQQPVLFRIASANTDETRFERPLDFDIRRHPNKHLSFGQGVHYCLGAPLARLDAKIALNRVLQRLHDIQSIPQRPAKNLQGFFTFGVQSFPITFRAVSSK